MKTNNGLAKHFSRLDNKTQAKKNSRGQRQISNKTKSREMTLGTTPFLSHACVHKKRSTCTWGRIGEGNSFPSVRRHRNRLRLELLYFLQSSTAGNRGSTQLWENNLRSVPIWRLGAAVSEFKHHSRLLLRGRRLQKQTEINWERKERFHPVPDVHSRGRLQMPLLKLEKWQ